MFTVKSGIACAVAALGLSAGAASAASLTISVTNVSGQGGLYLTPLYASFHNGSFDAFSAGSPASAGVEALAEEGGVDGVRAERIAADAGSQEAVLANPAGFGGAPVLDPGETASVEIDVDVANRFFSFLSMVIPSNDTFIGNDDPLAYELFDASGAYLGDRVITVDNADVWDAGTEANDGLGAAFSAAGGVSTDTMDAVSLAGDLSFLLGQETVAGTSVSSIPGVGGALATISISRVSAVPLPAAAPLLLTGFGLLGWVGSRRKRAA